MTNIIVITTTTFINHHRTFLRSLIIVLMSKTLTPRSELFWAQRAPSFHGSGVGEA